MNFISGLFRGRHEPDDREKLRRGANVIADAVETARDQEIQQGMAELAEAREVARRKRVEVLLAARLARDVRRAVETAGESFEVSMGQVARRIVGGDD